MLKNCKVLYFISVVILVLVCADFTNGLLRRCFQCRSRGELGDCKDPFKLNATQAESVSGVAAVPCASGWCGKVLEGGGAYNSDDFDIATQRMCVQRGPDDSEDRCAYTTYNYKKVFMCFCQGDLCNSSNNLGISKYLIIGIALYACRRAFVK